MIEFQAVPRLTDCLGFVLIPFLHCTYIQLEVLKPYQRYIDIFTFCIYPMGHIIIGCEVCRLWLICYDLNYLHLSSSTELKSKIDRNQTEETHWWLKHENRSKFGNLLWLKYRVMAWCMVAAVTTSALYQIWGWTPITQVIDAFFYAAPISFELYSFYMCPKIKVFAICY